MHIGYARVSTDDQILETQITLLRDCGCERVYAEIISGRAEVRAELDRAVGELSEADVLIVWRLDRLGRSLTGIIRTIDAIHARGASVRSLHDGVDTSTSTGRMIAGILATLADYEVEMIRDRTRAGLATARAAGRVGGRPAALNAERKAAARQMLADGKSVRQVARIFAVSPSTIQRAAHHGTGF